MLLQLELGAQPGARQIFRQRYSHPRLDGCVHGGRACARFFPRLVRPDYHASHLKNQRGKRTNRGASVLQAAFRHLQVFLITSLSELGLSEGTIGPFTGISTQAHVDHPKCHPSGPIDARDELRVCWTEPDCYSFSRANLRSTSGAR